MRELTRGDISMFRRTAETSGIYGIKCVETGKWYVGASVRLYSRLHKHIKDLDRGFNAHVEDSNQGYNFRFFLLEETQSTPRAEIKWIVELDALVNGYNSSYFMPHLWPKEMIEEFKAQQYKE